MIWIFLHNAVVHPMFVLVELFTRFVDWLHEWTAVRAYGYG